MHDPRVSKKMDESEMWDLYRVLIMQGCECIRAYKGNVELKNYLYSNVISAACKALDSL